MTFGKTKLYKGDEGHGIGVTRRKTGNDEDNTYYYILKFKAGEFEIDSKNLDISTR